jgi:amino acid transporter
VLAFFAFIGFEDIINVAEETRDPERTLPLGLILAMAGAALLYIAVAITSVSVVPWQELAEAPGPITEVVTRAAPSIPPVIFTGVTLFAVTNTALQLHHRLAPHLWHGAPGPLARGIWQGPRRQADAAYCHCGAVFGAGAACSVRNDR